MNNELFNRQSMEKLGLAAGMWSLGFSRKATVTPGTQPTSAGIGDACTDVTWFKSTPCIVGWEGLNRIGRYLAGASRFGASRRLFTYEEIDLVREISSMGIAS